MCSSWSMVTFVMSAPPFPGAHNSSSVVPFTRWSSGFTTDAIVVDLSHAMVSITCATAAAVYVFVTEPDG